LEILKINMLISVDEIFVGVHPPTSDVKPFRIENFSRTSEKFIKIIIHR